MASLTEERRLARERKLRRGEPVPVVEPGPAGHIIGAEHARAAEPYIASVRQELFGSPTAPWGSPEAPGAVSWNAARMARALGGGETQEDQILDRAVRAVAEGTGFETHDVVEWITCGIRPSLHPAMYSVRFEKRRLPDGTVLRRQYQTLTLHGPVTEREVIRIWRSHLRGFWSHGSADGAMGQKTLMLTDLDHHLDQLVERMPAPATWADRAEEWRRTPPDGWTAAAWRKSQGGATANTLRVRWHRLEKKKEALWPKEETHGTP